MDRGKRRWGGLEQHKPYRRRVNQFFIVEMMLGGAALGVTGPTWSGVDLHGFTMIVGTCTLCKFYLITSQRRTVLLQFAGSHAQAVCVTAWWHTGGIPEVARGASHGLPWRGPSGGSCVLQRAAGYHMGYQSESVMRGSCTLAQRVAMASALGVVHVG
ncbi:hypothetical protein EI94DRAFT_1793011 [Lactarius quietus]|nr:hypothetical protein EI94DRAFT_1793011 [Lactarius quietus]